MHQFRIFDMLKHDLREPTLLFSHSALALTPRMVYEVVARYYDFNPKFMRELLGVKIGSKIRKDIPKISLRLHLNSPSCYRQFDNLKNLFRDAMGDEAEEKEAASGGVYEMLLEYYLLQPELAK